MEIARGAVGLTDPSSELTAFTDLTEQQVKGWVQSQIDEVEQSNSQIESLKKSTSSNQKKSLEWGGWQFKQIKQWQ